ncbi:MAG: hypothetical protein KBC32_00360 [Candidatus Didemnitutus sp.]|nr:hypothetical protein [Candidatus Didemnitutus sp.]
MKPTRLLLLAAAATTLLLATGCQTVETRIKEKPEAFASLDAETQAKVKQGIIDLGYSEDAVYLALGAPDQKRESRSAAGAQTVWIYNTYYERYDGTRFAGYARRVYWDPVLKTYRFHYHPVYAETYRPEVEERIRITFENGKVTVIEQSKG